MNPFVEGGAILTLFFLALGFLHGRKDVEPMLEWMFLYSAAVLFFAYITVLLGHMAVPLFNPLPVTMRENVHIVNDTLRLSLNITRPPEQGTGFVPGAWYYVAATVFFGGFPTLGYIVGYWGGARIAGLEVEFYEYIRGDGRRILKVDVYPYYPRLREKSVRKEFEGEPVVVEVYER